MLFSFIHLNTGWIVKKIILLFVVLLTSCSFFQSTSKKSSNKPLVIVSAAPYKKIVQQLAKSRVEVRTIIPADVDPHNFEPSPRDMAELLNTSLWVQVGEEFEGLLERRLKEISPKLHILSLPQVTKSLQSSCNHHHNHDYCHNIDTHYWLDPVTVMEQAKYIVKALKEILPEDAAYFDKRLAGLEKKLTEIDRQILKELEPYHGNTFLTTHKAYGYFCHRYDLVQIGIEADDGKETRTQEIHQVLQKATYHKKELVGILIQPQHINRAAEILGGKLSLPLFMVNPYEENYIATIKKLANITLKYGKNQDINQ
ncbi:MAG: High-affinity zinc uptake system protein ZnuA [Chlamydiia bacterium]|nr:High-affinity zinc uptake system protein ZnuA [Chlamydiia bacterium]